MFTIPQIHTFWSYSTAWFAATGREGQCFPFLQLNSRWSSTSGLVAWARWGNSFFPQSRKIFISTNFSPRHLLMDVQSTERAQLLLPHAQRSGHRVRICGRKDAPLGRQGGCQQEWWGEWKVQGGLPRRDELQVGSFWRWEAHRQRHWSQVIAPHFHLALLILFSLCLHRKVRPVKVVKLSCQPFFTTIMLTDTSRQAVFCTCKSKCSCQARRVHRSFWLFYYRATKDLVFFVINCIDTLMWINAI